MDEVPNTNFPGEMPSAPPPPPEVKVRTMRSDLESMTESGGGLPKFQTVKVAGLAVTQENKKKSAAVITLVIIAALAVLGLLGYFAYQMFFVKPTSAVAPAPSGQTGVVPAQGGVVQGGVTQGGVVQTPAATPTQTPAATPIPTPAAPAAPAASAPAPFIHASLFKTPADQTLILTLSAASAAGATASTADLQTFNQKVSALLAAQANKGAAVIEIIVQTADHHGVPVGDLWAQANSAVVSPQLLAAHFNPDATFFIYQDKNGFWPAYVLSLKAGENWLFSQSDIANLESSPGIANFFLTNVGAPSAKGFTGTTVSSAAVRALSFPSATPPATFLYGWYKNDLIMSASQAGFAAAMGRL